MKRSPYFISTTAIPALLTTLFTLEVDPVRAQQAEEEQDNTMTEEIVVKVKPEINRKVERTSATGSSTETLTLVRHVSYTDLDLSKYGDVTELKKRIETNAREACEEVDKVSPLNHWTSAEMQACINSGIESANNDLEAAISAAK